MFKRKPTYLMEIDAQVRYALDETRRNIPEVASTSDDELRALLADALEREALRTAGEALDHHGQRMAKRIKGGGHVRETGTEFMTNRLGEHYVTISVVFEGDVEGAKAATDTWVASVQQFKGIEQIGRVSLRGTDGTNIHVFDEETEAAVANMDPEMAAMIDELMDSTEGRIGH